MQMCRCQNQWRREGVCRPGQTSVLPHPPIRLVLQSGYFSRFRTWGVNQPLGPLPLPSLHLPSHPPISDPFSYNHLEVGSLNSVRRYGERCKLPERGLGRSPGRNLIWIFRLKIWHLVATSLKIF